jgi:hypothetical protein
MRKIYTYLSVISILSVFGCDSENAMDCFKTTGEIVQQEVSLESFNSIEVLDEVDIYLFNSDKQKVIIKAGENLISKIHLDVNDQLLSITNDNRCNWRRSPENPGIYIYSDDLSKISIFDFSNFYSLDSLILDNLHIFSDGTGNFDMTLVVDSLSIKSTYISNFKLRGEAYYLQIDFSDDSQFLGQDLKSSYCEIIHNGSNRIEIYPIITLAGTLYSTGNLYYFNNPDILDIAVFGSGELIYQSN